MKLFHRISIAIVALSFTFSVGLSVTFAATTPSLGAADTFGILAKTFARNFSGTAITGDLGYTTLTGTGTYTVSGTTYVSGGIYNQAVTDRNTALTALNSQTCTHTFPSGAVDLATDISHGALGVYVPGVYCSSSVNGVTIGAAGITLRGSGTYIFRFNGSITTATSSHVTLENGASACNVFWTLADNAIVSTLGASSIFSGTLFDTVSLSMHNNVTWVGRALLSEGTVGISYDDQISVPTSCMTPSPATLHVIKHVINNDGGTATASSFNLHVKTSGSMGGNIDVVGSPAIGVESPGRSYSLSAGAYVVSEDTFSGYTLTFSGDCDASGNVALTSGVDKTCTITNDDVAVKVPPPPTPESAILHVIKTVINDDGGTAVSSEAVVHVSTSKGDVTGSPRTGASSPGNSYVLSAGTYTVSEDFFAGYKVAISGDCTASGDVRLAPGDTKTCTITNNDIAGVIDTPTTIITTTTTTTTKPPCDICALLTYDVYIINPDGTQRHTGTPWVEVTDRGNGIKRYSFEDATLDPKNPLFDHNDSVIDVDLKDCKGVTFMFVSSDASWKHQVRIKVSIDGVSQSDTLVANDSRLVVGTSKTVNATTGVNVTQACSQGPSSISRSLLGKILLQVQAHGEAWYVHPSMGLRYYMKDGTVAYGMMRNFGLGITDKNLTAIPSVTTVDELKKLPSICTSNNSANKVKGWILLQVQAHGEAWYVDATRCRRIYMKDGAAAYTLMRFLGLGITDVDLEKIKIGL